MKLAVFNLICILLVLPAFAQNTDSLSEKKSVHELILESKLQNGQAENSSEWTIRKLRATILSGIIPGTGQTYLGSEYKGVAITIGFAGSVLAAILNHNNFTSREDRITNLLIEYNGYNNYADADKVWQSIEKEKAARDKDNLRRKYFSYAAIAIWIYNMIDVVYYTEDAGTEQFSLTPQPVPSYCLFPKYEQDQILTFRINLF